MKQDLEKKLIDWLNTQGYPLEMSSSSLLIEENFDVSQKTYYKDPETNEPREIDIKCSLYDKTSFLKLSFLIECKSPSKPWLLFTSENTLAGYNRFFSFALYSDMCKEEFINKPYDKIKSLPWFFKNGRIANGMTQAFSSGIDIPYKASLSALKAAISEKFIGDNILQFNFSFPIIIIDCDLIECYLDSSGKIVLKEVEKNFLHFPLNIASITSPCIYVFTKKYLPTFIKEAKLLNKKLSTLFQDDLEKLSNDPNHIL